MIIKGERKERKENEEKEEKKKEREDNTGDKAITKYNCQKPRHPQNFEQLSPLSSENSTSTHTSQFTVARILVIGLSCWLFRLRGPSVFARRCHPTHH